MSQPILLLNSAFSWMWHGCCACCYLSVLPQLSLRVLSARLLKGTAGSSHRLLRLTGLVQAAFIHLGKPSLPKGHRDGALCAPVSQFNCDGSSAAGGAASTAASWATATAGPRPLRALPKPTLPARSDKPRPQTSQSTWLSLRRTNRSSLNSSPVSGKDFRKPHDFLGKRGFTPVGTERVLQPQRAVPRRSRTPARGAEHRQPAARPRAGRSRAPAAAAAQPGETRSPYR